MTYNHAVKHITVSTSRTHEMNITDPARLKQIISVACSFLIKLPFDRKWSVHQRDFVTVGAPIELTTVARDHADAPT